MKIVSENIKSALKQPTTQRKGRILVNGNYYDVFNVEYYADAYNEGNVIGNAIASQLDFDLPYMPKFDTFKYFDGVWTGTNYEYVDMGTFTVFDEQDEDEFNKHIISFDNLIKFNAPFQDVGGYPKTLFSELQNVCRQAGIGLNNTSIPNGNFKVVNNQFTNGESLKTVLKSICSISGNYATIKNDKLTLQLKNVTNGKLEKMQHEPVVWKRKSYGINQVVIGLSDIEGEYVLRQDDEDIAKNGIHKLVVNDNLFAYNQDKREELVDELFNQVKGFGYTPYEMNCEWFNYYEVGDTIVIDDIETIILRINGKSPKALESVISAPAIIDGSVDYVNNTDTIQNQIKRTEIIVDKQNQEIQSLASKVVDVSSNANGVGKVKLENAYEGQLHYLSIRGNISLLFPSSQKLYGFSNIISSSNVISDDNIISSGVHYENDILYPSNVLYPRGTTLTIDDVEYKLDFDYLNYMNDNVYDEFIYEDGTCKIVRRIGVDESYNMYPLENEVIENRKGIDLKVKDDSTIILNSFPNAILNIKYLTQNDYTDVFANKVDVSSQIKVTTDNILLESKSYTDIATEGDALISKINLDSTGNVKIEASKTIDLTGTDINLTSDNVTISSNNFNVDKQGNATMSSANITNGNINLISIGTNAKFKITDSENSSCYWEQQARGINWYGYNGGKIQLYNVLPTPQLVLSNAAGTSVTNITSSYIQSPVITQTSLEENKKNFKLFDGALSIIKNIDIYKYNLKNEENTHKKHIGFVIGDDYKYSSEITAVDEEGKEIGVDVYSMASLCLQAIKEQQEIINNLKNKIEVLENEKNNFENNI